MAPEEHEVCQARSEQIRDAWEPSRRINNTGKYKCPNVWMCMISLIINRRFTAAFASRRVLKIAYSLEQCPLTMITEIRVYEFLQNDNPPMWVYFLQKMVVASGAFCDFWFGDNNSLSHNFRALRCPKLLLEIMCGTRTSTRLVSWHFKARGRLLP